MAELVEAGRGRHLGLSAVVGRRASARAHAGATRSPRSQSEYALFTRELAD